MGKAIYTHKTTWQYQDNVKVRDTVTNTDHHTLERAQMHFHYLKCSEGIQMVELIDLITGKIIQSHKK